jgi:hypothetical protein
MLRFRCIENNHRPIQYLCPQFPYENNSVQVRLDGWKDGRTRDISDSISRSEMKDSTHRQQTCMETRNRTQSLVKQDAKVGKNEIDRLVGLNPLAKMFQSYEGNAKIGACDSPV